VKELRSFGLFQLGASVFAGLPSAPWSCLKHFFWENVARNV